MRATAFAALIAATSLAGCAWLLPSSDVATRETWEDFEQAKDAIERIVPHQSQRADLKAAHIDPYLNPAVTILSFAEVAQRLSLGSAISRDELEPGVRECLVSGKVCNGYSIVVRKTERKRSGNFWLDFLSFRREVEVTGWTFNALILLVGDTVVYTLHSGQPKFHEREVSRNPLGPLQGIGEGIGRELVP